MSIHPNSLEVSLTKKELAEQHAALVRELMLLWGQHFPMHEWVDPLSAVSRLQALRPAKCGRVNP